MTSEKVITEVRRTSVWERKHEKKQNSSKKWCIPNATTGCILISVQHKYLYAQGALLTLTEILIRAQVSWAWTLLQSFICNIYLHNYLHSLSGFEVTVLTRARVKEQRRQSGETQLSFGRVGQVALKPEEGFLFFGRLWDVPPPQTDKPSQAEHSWSNHPDGSQLFPTWISHQNYTWGTLSMGSWAGPAEDTGWQEFGACYALACKALNATKPQGLGTAKQP